MQSRAYLSWDFKCSSLVSVRSFRIASILFRLKWSEMKRNYRNANPVPILETLKSANGCQIEEHFHSISMTQTLSWPVNLCEIHSNKRTLILIQSKGLSSSAPLNFNLQLEVSGGEQSRWRRKGAKPANTWYTSWPRPNNKQKHTMFPMSSVGSLLWLLLLLSAC